MKNLINIVFVTVLLLLSLLAQAQDLRNNPALQERFTQAKLRAIQKELQLSEPKLKALTPIYQRYDAELNAIHFERLEGRPQGNMMQLNPDSLSVEDADRFVTAQLDNAVKMSTLRQKYYPEFKAVLTPQQVMKLYQSEAQLRRRVMQEFRKRMGNRRR